MDIEDSAIDDNRLYSVLSEIFHEIPNAGEVYIIGSLRARGLRIARRRVREHLQIIDSVGRAFRRTTTIQRRVYSVHGANYLW